MRKKNFKGRCEKRMIGKCTEVCRTYDAIQYAYADLLQASDEVKEIRCNVLYPMNLLCYIEMHLSHLKTWSIEFKGYMPIR